MALDLTLTSARSRFYGFQDYHELLITRRSRKENHPWSKGKKKISKKSISTFREEMLNKHYEMRKKKGEHDRASVLPLHGTSIELSNKTNVLQ